MHFDIDNIKITQKSNIAWFSLCASLEQLEVNDVYWQFYANQMKELLEKNDGTSHDKMFEATHFGIRRLRERNLGVGHRFKMVITGVLIKQGSWKFHTLHWSMSVD